MTVDNKSIERLTTPDGIELHCEIHPADTHEWLVCVHGIGEHIGRENHLAQLFGNQYKVLRFDLRGHGKSGGRRGYVNSFDQFYHDLAFVIDRLSTTHPNFKYRLFGHSMGALIAAGFTQSQPQNVQLPEKLFLASPPIGIGGPGGAIVNRLPKSLLTSLRKFPLSLPIRSVINRNYLSHAEPVATRITKDALSLKSLHSRLLFSLVEASKTVFSRPINAPGPLYCAIGNQDRIVSFPEAQKYFSRHEPSATFHIVEGAYHELHNESEAFRKPYFTFLKGSLS